MYIAKQNNKIETFQICLERLNNINIDQYVKDNKINCFKFKQEYFSCLNI